MKLLNKKTGEIIDFNRIVSTEFGHKILLQATEYHDKPIYIYNSLAELNEEWEDYKEPKKYWFINPCGEVVSFYEEDENPADTKASKAIGDYFDTREEAEKAVEKLKAWKRLKDKGFKFDGWEGWKYQKVRYEFDFTVLSEDGEKEVEKDLDLLFGGEE